MNVLIAMPAPRLPEAAREAASRSALPRLPGLEQLLRSARRTLSTDWRRGVQVALGGSDAGIAPVAIAARAASSLGVDVACCFATPLQVVAGMSRVHLPPEGLLQIGSEEAEQWRAAFNAEFGSDTVHLHAAGPGAQWLLEAPFAHAAQDMEPALLSGEALARTAAASPPARDLRRLGAEVEMWLAPQALNRGRVKRREPELNALWFWGGGRNVAAPALQAPRVLASATGSDAWLAGLAAQLDRPLRHVTSWTQLMQHIADAPPDTGLDALAVLAADVGASSGQYWQMLEHHWFAPAALALQERHVRSMQLQMGNATWQVQKPSSWAWLKPRRHWSALLDTPA